MPHVYHYDPETLVYTNRSSDADEDPMEPGRYLLPANTTLEVPPFVGDPKKKHAVFREGAWVVELIPVPPPLKANLKAAPKGGMWPRGSIKEALKGGVT